ncbi:hypothetical protein GCM10025751_43850 [Haladaptatus pallidirubidus]|uniref:Uncharacterized protein n=1 Tax=Haladaptatus pallidirubidus TaxID=1008152 RepID=A0AAV3UN90_9EURY
MAVVVQLDAESEDKESCEDEGKRHRRSSSQIREGEQHSNQERVHGVIQRVFSNRTDAVCDEIQFRKCEHRQKRQTGRCDRGQSDDHERKPDGGHVKRTRFGRRREGDIAPI